MYIALVPMETGRLFPSLESFHHILIGHPHLSRATDCKTLYWVGLHRSCRGGRSRCGGGEGRGGAEERSGGGCGGGGGRRGAGVVVEREEEVQKNKVKEVEEVKEDGEKEVVVERKEEVQKNEVGVVKVEVEEVEVEEVMVKGK